MRPLTQDEIDRLSVRTPKPQREREKEREREREKEKRRRRWRELPAVSPTPARNTVQRDIAAMIRYHETSWGKGSFRNHCIMTSYEAVGGNPETYRVLRAAVRGLPAVWNNAPERTRGDVLRLLRGILHGKT